MRNHQRLHGRAVFLHQIADARVGVDDDLVSQPHIAPPIAALCGQKLLAIAPVPVVDGHAHAGIGIHHLLSRDDLQLVGICVQPIAFSRRSNGCVVLLNQLKRPVAGVRQRAGRALRSHQRSLRHIARPLTLSGLIPGFSAGTGVQRRVESEVHTDTPSFLKRSRNTG